MLNEEPLRDYSAKLSAVLQMVIELHEKPGKHLDAAIDEVENELGTILSSLDLHLEGGDADTDGPEDDEEPRECLFRARQFYTARNGKAYQITAIDLDMGSMDGPTYAHDRDTLEWNLDGSSSYPGEKEFDLSLDGVTFPDAPSEDDIVYGVMEQEAEEIASDDDKSTVEADCDYEVGEWYPDAEGVMWQIMDIDAEHMTIQATDGKTDVREYGLDGTATDGKPNLNGTM
jgi:hypothetical protein